MTANSDQSSSRSGQLTASLTTTRTLPEGHVLAGRFRILGAIGIGGQAHVYAARDEILGTDIAVKLIAPQHALDVEQVRRLRQEVLLARELNHPNIVRVFEFYQDGQWVFFTMGLIGGRSLAEFLHEGISRKQTERWSSQLLLALQACHGHDITHADVKPENILIDERGNLVLLDFGIGVHGDLVRPDFAGSQGYKAPEVTQFGKATPRSDSYSSGRLLSDMLAATHKRLWHVGDWRWYLRLKRVAKQLSKPLAHQRISVQEAQERLTPSSQRNMTYTGAGIALSVVVMLYFVWTSPVGEQSTSPASEMQTTRIAIVYNPDDFLLSGIAELLQLHLITQRGVDVIEQDRVDTLMRNLGLRPFRQQEHRNRLSQLVNADVLVMLQNSQLSQDDSPRVQLLIAEMPGNRLYGAFQGTVSNDVLPQTMEQLLSHLNEQLALPTRQPIVRPEELQRVEPVLRAIREGRDAEAALFAQSLQEEWPEFAGGWLAGARLSANRGNLQAARDQLARVFELSQDDDYWHLEARALEAEMAGDVTAAIAVTDRLIQVFPGRAGLLDRRAELALWQDDAETAIQMYQAALELDPSSAERWFELARLRIIQGEIQQALDNELTQALIKFRQQENMRGQGMVLNAFGVAYLRWSDPGTAVRYFNEALQFRTEERDPAGRAVTLANLANAKSIQRQYSEAEAALAEASVLFSQNNDQLGLAQVENEWGILLEEQGRYREALTHYRLALDLRVEAGATLQQAESINNVAYMHFLMADFSQADIFWKQSLNIFTRIGDQSGILRTKLNLAHLSLTRGDYTSATQILSDVLEQSRDRRPEEELVTQYFLSHRNFSLGLVQTAMQNSMRALELAEEIGNIRAVIETRIWIAEMCAQLADSVCITEQINVLSEQPEHLNAEQEILVEWLTKTVAVYEQRYTASDIAVFWSKFRKQLLPVQTELRVLLLTLELHPAPKDSWQWERVRELTRPVMYKEHMHGLYLQAVQFNDEAARENLRRMLQNYPYHWRNHLYYEIFSDEDSQRRADELRSALFEHMTPDQIEAYQRVYERSETQDRARN
ncbi:serine/threonine-protein kinase [Aliidiomarina sanyensis]|uniref:non-specific serine/threonine protein kinase n=1 Tax=Aliidiomarina sanyensis TaxID=1249555 RepID=A0A432WG35_9GAMM|nr:serine/threonine-protein kinase [Aliidiomarina sanyensis]RUO32705.1 hypothetical protein CWE11_07985 [Aliidiomarina sanyensis]